MLRYPLLPGHTNDMYTLEFQLELFFPVLYINILFHVLSETVEDRPFIYCIACCCISQ
jgi:hypothetical protein